MDNLRIVFMGTPDFAVVPFNALVKAGYDVCLAVTQPDSRKGRGKKLVPAPVKTAAEAAGVPAAQPEKIKGNDEFLNKIREIAPDIIIVAAYGRILPSAIYMHRCFRDSEVRPPYSAALWKAIKRRASL